MSGKPPPDIRTLQSGDAPVSRRADVGRLRAEMNTAALGCEGTAALSHPVQTADAAAPRDADLARVLPVVPELAGLLPWPGGIRRGATVAAVGSTSLLMTLLAGATRGGSWAAVLGLPEFGALAAGQDFGIDLARLALVPAPGPDWPTVVAALIDGVALVAVTAPPAPDAVIRALMARARQRGCVLLPTVAWPGCDLTVESLDRRWSGLGTGHGRLRQQAVTLRAVGPGRATRSTTATTALPPPSLSRIGDQPPTTLPAPTPPAPPTATAALTEEPAAEWGHGLRAVVPPADPWAELTH